MVKLIDDVVLETEDKPSVGRDYMIFCSWHGQPGVARGVSNLLRKVLRSQRLLSSLFAVASNRSSQLSFCSNSNPNFKNIRPSIGQTRIIKEKKENRGASPPDAKIPYLCLGKSLLNPRV
jgi:hypothetical protein